MNLFHLGLRCNEPSSARLHFRSCSDKQKMSYINRPSRRIQSPLVLPPFFHLFACQHNTKRFRLLKPILTLNCFRNWPFRYSVNLNFPSEKRYFRYALGNAKFGNAKVANLVWNILVALNFPHFSPVKSIIYTGFSRNGQMHSFRKIFLERKSRTFEQRRLYSTVFPPKTGQISSQPVSDNLYPRGSPGN